MRLDSFEGVIGKKKDQRADNRREMSVKVESDYTDGSEGIVQPASGHGAHHSQ